MILYDLIEKLECIRAQHGGHIKVVFPQTEAGEPDCVCCHYSGEVYQKSELVEVDSVSCEIPEPHAAVNTRKVVLR